MKQAFREIHVACDGQCLVEITAQVQQFCEDCPIEMGLLNLSILHTSASLLIQENASSEVLHDLQSFFERLVPMDNSLYQHDIEGKDDMPGHIKSALTQSNLTLSLRDGSLALGHWQGIFLFEHRIQPHQRTVLAHIMGE